MSCPIEEKIIESIYMYRALPALYTIVADFAPNLNKEVALADLQKSLKRQNMQITDSDLMLLLQKLKPTIDYCMNDFSFYAKKFKLEPTTELYGSYMDSLADMLYCEEPFKINEKYIHILDIGCGRMSYIEHFAASNKQAKIKYTGIDKRKEFSLSGYEYNILDGAAGLKKRLSEPVNVLFFGNFLHCISVWDIIVLDCVHKLKPKHVKVLEPNEDVVISMFFDSHMLNHSGGVEFTRKSAKELAKMLGTTLSIQRVNDYFTMFTYSL